ncbi:MAG: 16S rRNA (cytosine(1402)-N(4))-methyltransferase RsmH [Ignavibacteria bacterium]|nr:16S rRNA (cytosine(1402)-N(4))-methyltransferase RsmH [Ignavibacteria bacterium]MBK7413226.1 16S rRNA (cytosine(1402)-N(4))-methyltransferase RsmH [Ignavibacteria bacterium]MBK9181659.1 16S rRNA (cytosine(1402)-N(4))-methyltransferase RsmH [Ignavibacteria bacterium]MBP7092817.1 16S rRNA (cytosine(1402)-N(4))-methyltransferase RsmH [Candidatus Kapabacteria bacterium]
MARLDAETYHIPVMLQECITYLAMQPGGVYVDGTLGGGGHTAAMLSVASDASRIFAFDADEKAIEHCQVRFAEELARGEASRLVLVHANFDTMAEVLNERVAQHGHAVNGILLDLGVSSFQFDHHHRGFSFRHMAPLDMRFMPEGETAADILNSRTEPELAKIFRDFGDEPQAWRLAKAIAQRRQLARFATTADLRDLVIQQIPPHHQPKTMARLFQALRIAVNRELERLESTLLSMIPVLAPGGRIVVMSYHSGEDRVVKNVFRGNTDTLNTITKKAVEAAPEEVYQNPRARSARLRVAERRA